MVNGTCHGCGTPVPPSRNPGTPRKWCSERCRKRSYGDPCVDCGAQTRFGAETARIPEPRCHGCAVEHYRRWSRDLVLARIREWVAIHGEPPASPDWRPYFAENVLHDYERAERWRAADGHWPSYETCRALFGTWTAAIVAAGFEPYEPHASASNYARRRDRRARAAA